MLLSQGFGLEQHMEKVGVNSSAASGLSRSVQRKRGQSVRFRRCTDGKLCSGSGHAAMARGGVSCDSSEQDGTFLRTRQRLGEMKCIRHSKSPYIQDPSATRYVLSSLGVSFATYAPRSRTSYGVRNNSG